MFVAMGLSAWAALFCLTNCGAAELTNLNNKSRQVPLKKRSVPYVDRNYRREHPKRFQAWGYLGPARPNKTLPSGTSISCNGTKHEFFEVTLGLPHGNCAVTVSHISQFPGGCVDDDIYTPARSRETKIGRLGPAQPDIDMQLLLLERPHVASFYFAYERHCHITTQIPYRVRKNGASTGETDALVIQAVKATGVSYYSHNKEYSPPVAWIVKAPPWFATPDDSGALVEGLVDHPDGQTLWCRMGLLVGGEPDMDVLVVLPIETVVSFASSYNDLCGVKASHRAEEL